MTYEQGYGVIVKEGFCDGGGLIAESRGIVAMAVLWVAITTIDFRGSY
jgi:hypothetical protein